jgi:endogenous inhibitor of DNA gyrase (YacG/DUF329 family)
VVTSVIEGMTSIIREYKDKDAQGKTRIYVDVKCSTCGKICKKVKRFLKEHSFCSPKCQYTWMDKRQEVSCATCGKTFKKRQSEIRKAKNGLYFCCRKCKDLAARLDGGIPDIQPDFYGTGVSNYRDIAFRELPKKCNRCGYDEYPEIVQVHHKDGNRDNNNISNLEPLCPNCHAIEHRIKLMRKKG